MTLFRVQHSKNYIVVNNYICRDNRLSWKAKGIWLYAFSRPDDWQFYLSDIIAQSTDGEKSVKAGLKELIEFGYLKKTQKKDERGKFDAIEWCFYETPQEIQIILPQPQNRLPEKRLPEKEALLSIDKPSIEKEQQQRQPKSHEKKTFLPPSQASAAAAVFSCLENLNISKKDKVWITEHYPESVVKQAVAWATHPETKIKTSLVQALKWACVNTPEIPVGSEEKIAENKKYATSIRKNFKSKFCAIEDNHSETLFIPSTGKATCIKYTDNDFIEQCKKKLEYFKFENLKNKEKEKCAKKN